MTTESGLFKLSGARGPRGPRMSLQQRPTTAPAGPRGRHISTPMMSLTEASSSLQRTESPPPSQSFQPIPTDASPAPPYSSSPTSSATFPTIVTQVNIPQPTLSPLPDSPRPVRTPSPNTPKRVEQPASLPTPPNVKFEAVPVQWKGLPLEAALWTFDSHELGSIVSRAIRGSAKEAFVRILSLDLLDNTIPAEIERLESLKAAQQSRYRFNIHRRTMLLQALNSLQTQNSDDSTESLNRLVAQMSDTAIDCDRLAEELVKITDQLCQLKKLLDVHWASALAIALRKLNGSYGKRTADLLATRERVSHLEAELEDAWRSAEKMATEIDELHAAQEDAMDSGEEVDEEGTAIIGTAEIVALSSPVPQSPGRPTLFRLQSPPTPTFGAFSHDKTGPPSASIPREVDSEVVSVRSTKSKRSNRSGVASRSSMVSAARRRSVRTSMGSLRIPSRNTNRTSSVPPVPDVPQDSHSRPPTSFHASTSKQRASFLDLESRQSSAANLNTKEPSPSRRTRIEDIEIEAKPSTGRKRAISTMDDLHIMPLTSSEVNEIEEVPRYPQRRSVDDSSLIGATRRLDPTNHPTKTIPSIWLHADTPVTPAERVQSMMQPESSSKPGGSSSYLKLKGFTNRYSSPFPGIARSISSLKNSRTP